MQLIRTLRLNLVQILVIVLLVMLVSIIPRAASAQRAQPSGVTQQSGGEVALSRYNVEKKNEGAAGLYGFIFPTWGSSYAGEKESGYMPLALWVGGLGVALIGSSQQKVVCSGSGLSVNCSKKESILLPLGLLSTAVGAVWGGINAHNKTVDWNVALQRRLGLLP